MGYVCEYIYDCGLLCLCVHGIECVSMHVIVYVYVCSVCVSM